MRQIISQKTETITVLDEATTASLMAAMTEFMAANSEAEALAQIDLDAPRLLAA